MLRVGSVIVVGLLVVALAPAWFAPAPTVLLPTPTPCAVPGDMNCDGVVNCDDLNPFVQALSDPKQWQLEHPGCPIMNGDVNQDGVFDFGDINAFNEAISKRAIKGDANCDGCINDADVNAFVLALSNPCQYKHTYVGCPILNCDCNGDGLVNFSDINCFNDLLESNEIKGDMNCDRCVNDDDVNAFILAITDPVAWQALYPDCPLSNGDCNGDGVVDFDDINCFNELIEPPCE
jgi:hypothetical protein